MNKKYDNNNNLLLPLGHISNRGLALGRSAHAPSTDGVAETPAATATAPPAIPMAAEGRNLAVAAVHLSGQGAGSSGNPSEGHAIFTQARLAIHQMQGALDACQEGLRAREDEVRAREEEAARAEAAFRETARQAAEPLRQRGGDCDEGAGT